VKHATLCFVVDRSTNRVLLGRKKRGFGAGKLNGFGGKIDRGETAVDAVVREVREECGLVLSTEGLVHLGAIRFDFPWNRSFDHDVRVFLATAWTGVPQETEEMSPFWASCAAPPFEQMWADDRYWLPIALSMTQFTARFSFAQDNETVATWWMQLTPDDGC